MDGNGQGLLFGEASAGNVVRNNIFSNSVRRWNVETYNLLGAGNVLTANCVFASNPERYYGASGGERW